MSSGFCECEYKHWIRRGQVCAEWKPTWAARYDSTNFPAASPTGFALDNSNNVVVSGERSNSEVRRKWQPTMDRPL